MENKNQIISKIMIEIGIKPNLDGFKYLKDSIMESLNNPSLVHNMTKGLYAKVASLNSSTPAKVERSIRTAIDAGYMGGKLSKLNDIFGVEYISKYEKPSSGNLIAFMVDRLLCA